MTKALNSETDKGLQRAANPWAAKARALDQYRWQLLRERHNLLASALRFARDALGDWWFGVRAKRHLDGPVSVESCDFLLLQSAPNVIKLQRKKCLINDLRARGHNLVETALHSPKSILHERHLRRPPHPVPTRYLGMAAHAQWMVEHYQPRILLNDRNGSLYAPFLRLALNARGALLVHLAHSATLERSRRLSMVDYDYYFLFGKSSLEALQARKLLFGSSVAVLAGSHMIDESYDLPPADPALRTLLILGVGPDKESDPDYQLTYALLLEWAIAHPEYRVLIKAHPRSQVPFWREAKSKAANLQVLPSECSLDSALAKASLVVNVMSNAVIEAALARRPVIYVNAGQKPDIFSQEQFFGPCIADAEALQARVEQVHADYPASLQATEAFVDYHLSRGCAGLGQSIVLLEQLLHGEPCQGIVLPRQMGPG